MNAVAIIDRQFGRLLAESASGDTGLPLASSSQSWDASDARQKIAKWASSDGSGDPKTLDWAKYRKAFFWFDDKEHELLGSYKLPFATIVGGDLKAVWSAIDSVVGRLKQTHGIPDEQIKTIKSKIRTYYRRFGKGKPPFDRVEDLYLKLPGTRRQPLLVEGKLTPRQLRFLFAQKYAEQKGLHTIGQAGTPLGKQLSFAGGGLSAAKEAARRELGLSGLKGPRSAGTQIGTMKKVIAGTLRERLLSADQRHELTTRAKNGKPRQLDLKLGVKTSEGGMVKSTFYSNDGKHDYQASGVLGMRQYLLAANRSRKMESGFENFTSTQIQERFMKIIKAKTAKPSAA